MKRIVLPIRIRQNEGGKAKGLLGNGHFGTGEVTLTVTNESETVITEAHISEIDLPFVTSFMINASEFDVSEEQAQKIFNMEQ